MTANLWHVSYFIGLHTRNRIVHLLCLYHVFIAISIGFTKASFLGGDLFFIGTIGTDLPTQGRNGGGALRARAPSCISYFAKEAQDIFTYTKAMYYLILPVPTFCSIFRITTERNCPRPWNLYSQWQLRRICFRSVMPHQSKAVLHRLLIESLGHA